MIAIRIRPAAIAALALAFLLGGLAAAKPPVEAFANLPAMRSPGLSPDGTKFAAIQDMDGRPVVAIYTVGSSAAPIALPSDDWVIRAIQWVSNDHIVVIAGKGAKVPGGSRHLWTVNRAVAASADGATAVRLLNNIDMLRFNSSAAYVIDIALNDPAHIYMPLYSETRGITLNIFEVDLATGEGRRIAAGGPDTVNYVMDGQGHVVARVDVKPRSDVERLLVRDGDDWREVAAVKATVDSGLNVAGLTLDGTGLVRAAPSGGRYVLTRIDLASGKETVLLSDPRYDIDGTIEDPWTGRIVGAVYQAEGTRAVYFDPERTGFQATLERSFPGLSVAEVSSSIDRTRFIVALEGPRHPTSYLYIDRVAKVMNEVMSSYPGLTEDDLGEMKPYDYAARDGLLIPAFITLPPGKAPKNLPAIVMPHGGPDARDSLGFDWWAQFMANRGYVVLQPNYRGSSGYGRAFTEAGLQQWGLKMQDDITDGVLKMIADGIADPERICIVGASYGGYATLAGATLTPDLYACAVSIAGVSDLPEMIKWERTIHGRGSDVVDFWISRIGSPTDDSERLRATSPARQAAHAKCPILLMHGELDTTVPIRQSELMVDALASAGKPVSFVKLEGDDHYLQLGSTRLQMLTALETFLDEHIGD